MDPNLNPDFEIKPDPDPSVKKILMFRPADPDSILLRTPDQEPDLILKSVSGSNLNLKIRFGSESDQNTRIRLERKEKAGIETYFEGQAFNAKILNLQG